MDDSVIDYKIHYTNKKIKLTLPEQLANNDDNKIKTYKITKKTNQILSLRLHNLHPRLSFLNPPTKNPKHNPNTRSQQLLTKLLNIQSPKPTKNKSLAY